MENEEKYKHEFSIKAIKFSRYLMVRYFTAFYLFTNLFWLIFVVYYHAWLGVGIASSMIILIIIASIEQFNKWHTDRVNLPKTKQFYQIQILLNLILGIGILVKASKTFFPFSTSNSTDYLVLSILLIGILGGVLVIKRINNIEAGHDKYNKIIELLDKKKV